MLPFHLEDRALEDDDFQSHPPLLFPESFIYQLWPNPLHSPSLTISPFVRCTVCALLLPQSSLSHLSQEHGDGIPPGLPSFIIIPYLTYPSCCQRVAYVLKWKSHCITSLFKFFNRSHGPQKKHLVSLVWHIKTSSVFSSTRLLLSTLNPPTQSLRLPYWYMPCSQTQALLTILHHHALLVITLLVL